MFQHPCGRSHSFFRFMYVQKPRRGRGLQASPDAIMAALNVSTSRAVQKKLREVAKHHGGEVH